ncbi:DUF1911 domain-containing protein [Leeia sp. TBRC 13508]|uniref:DUF1911 domain-containing protein n=1 Tax=Leeia speluncae TaxID=2884804 RepID=A0ABS8D3Z3_9NEIS|nr:PoNe immunity protein domain-containing protein [Leeia speluncae]MCB6182926.1 DUF1911 domain-containing protein [Leeia speluncae]
MIRAEMGDRRYWEKAVQRRWTAINSAEELIPLPSGNPTYRPQYVWNYAHQFPRLTLTQYSRGDVVSELYNPFPSVLDAWELSNQEAEKICREHGLDKCRDWTFELANLEHYNWCFCLVGLALILEIPDDQWRRLLALVGDEGEDELLDRVIATRESGRTIGTKMLHKKPYARLLKALQAAPDQQAAQLHDFVTHWYAELKRKGRDEIWWYEFGNPETNPLEMGSYFGRWCVEAAVVAKVFQIDDSLCFGHAHYPGDLLRPNALPSPPSGIKKWLVSFYKRNK